MGNGDIKHSLFNGYCLCNSKRTTDVVGFAEFMKLDEANRCVECSKKIAEKGYKISIPKKANVKSVVKNEPKKSFVNAPRRYIDYTCQD